MAGTNALRDQAGDTSPEVSKLIRDSGSFISTMEREMSRLNPQDLKDAELLRKCLDISQLIHARITTMLRCDTLQDNERLRLTELNTNIVGKRKDLREKLAATSTSTVSTLTAVERKLRGMRH